MANVTIRNKKTGETRVVPEEQLPKYNIGGTATMQNQLAGTAGGQTNPQAVQMIQQRLQELQQPTQPQQKPQGGFLQSKALPIAGAVLGGGIGTLAGPVTGIAGAGAGYAGGDIMRKELAGLLGKDIGPGTASVAKQMETTPQQKLQSVGSTAKGSGEAAIAQTVGEGLGYALKFVRPNVTRDLLAKVTNLLSRKTGFNKIPPEVLQRRFMDEVIPKAIRFSQGQGEDVVQAGTKLLESKGIAGPKPIKVFDAEELNFLRKNLNSIGEGAEGMKKALIDGLAKVVREEQIAVAPATKYSLAAQKVAYKVPEALKAFWPTRMLLMISDAARSVASGPLSKLLKYGGGPLIQGMTQPQDQQPQQEGQQL